MSRIISRRKFLQALAAGTALGLLPDYFTKISAAEDETRPNVLLLMSDQHASKALGCADISYLTPNLDNLAGSGVRFTNCFASSPLCAPSRSSLMTGRAPHETGVFTNKSHLSKKYTTIGEVFSQNGYRTGYFGKWHLGRSPAEHGFQHVSTIENYKIRLTDWVSTQKALKFMNNAVRLNTPFFVVLSWVWPHPPRTLIDRYAYNFPLDQIPVPENFNDDLKNKPHRYRSRAARQKLTREKVLRIGRTYRTIVRKVDHWVGLMINELENMGITDNTIVAYTSDHGDMMGAHRLRGKGLAFEESIKIPFILRVPRIDPVRREADDLVSNCSIPGTLIEAAGIEVPDSFKGGSVLSSLVNADHPDDEAIFFEYRHLYKGIRTRTRKYVRHKRDIDEFYDLELDPLEMVNLIKDESYQADRAGLRSLLSEWRMNTEEN